MEIDKVEVAWRVKGIFALQRPADRQAKMEVKKWWLANCLVKLASKAVILFQF